MTRFIPTERGEPCAWAVAEKPEAPGWYLRCDGCPKRCDKKHHSEWEKRRDARARSPRIFPAPTGGRRGQRGYCRWCGDMLRYYNGAKVGEIDLRRGWHDGREDEPDCLHAFFLHTWPDFQRRHLEHRDGEKCWDCGGVPHRWLRGSMVGVWEENWPKGMERPTYQEITWVTALEIDHEVPLWSVAHLPDDERSAYFSPVNLRLRCASCHQAKTKREAGERAALRSA